MTPTDLRALLEGATKGPWTATNDNTVESFEGFTVLTDEGQPKEDNALIVAAVNALPAFVALWEAAEALMVVLPVMPTGLSEAAANAVDRALAALKGMP